MDGGGYFKDAGTPAFISGLRGELKVLVNVSAAKLPLSNVNGGIYADDSVQSWESTHPSTPLTHLLTPQHPPSSAHPFPPPFRQEMAGLLPSSLLPLPGLQTAPPGGGSSS